MTKSKLTDYVINPYTGCQHGCIYCYADFMRRFQNIKERWGEFIFPKINCPELLPKELEKNKPGNILMSSVCDCYTPIESKYKLTRKILEIFTASEFKDKYTMEILTKSILVKRDFDLIKQPNIELGMSVNGLDDKFSRVIEPVASLPKDRIETLRQASKYGIKTFGFISPVTVFTDLEGVFRELKDAECQYVWVEILNIKGSAQSRFSTAIKKNFLDKNEAFLNMINNYEDFCQGIEKQARELEKKYQLKIIEVVVH